VVGARGLRGTRRLVYGRMPRLWIGTMAVLVACLLASIVIATIKLT
jgi:hypothetical protein